MDVSGSSKATEAIFKNLKWLEKEIGTWLIGDSFSHVNYRMGDELFILSSREHYTLFIAIYAKLLWESGDFPLKCSFHSADMEIPAGDPEQWSHEAIKDTRRALDQVKKSYIQDFTSPVMSREVDVALMYATDILNHMTDIQRQVASFKIGGMLQKDISARLDKNESTISAHYSKSRGRQLTSILAFLAEYYEVDDGPLRQGFNISFKRRAES